MTVNPSKVECTTQDYVPALCVNLQLAQTKQQALYEPYQRNPERFVIGRPTVALPPEKLVINPVTEEELVNVQNRLIRSASTRNPFYLTRIPRFVTVF